MRRRKILEVIQNYPGISFNEIVKKTKLSNGVVSHHILQLMKDKELIKEGNKRGKYFDTNVSKDNREVIVILRNNTNLEILKFLLKMKYPQTTKEIGEAVKKSSSTISITLKKLKKESLIETKILNRNLKLTSDLGYQISKEGFLNKILKMYNI
tara:strand:- start:626 stop:1087 length:462 start_codon:yes stop_codon:yes gene_type:complete